MGDEFEKQFQIYASLLSGKPTIIVLCIFEFSNIYLKFEKLVIGRKWEGENRKNGSREKTPRERGKEYLCLL